MSCRVAQQFPRAPQFFGWIHVDRAVETAPQLFGLQRQQPIDDGVGSWLQILRRAKRTVGVSIGRLENRALCRQRLEITSENVEIVRARIKRRDAHHLALRAVVAVIVVTGDVGDLFLSEDACESARQRRLAARRIANDGEHRG